MVKTFAEETATKLGLDLETYKEIDSYIDDKQHELWEAKVDEDATQAELDELGDYLETTFLDDLPTPAGFEPEIFRTVTTHLKRPY